MLRKKTGFEHKKNLILVLHLSITAETEVQLLILNIATIFAFHCLRRHLVLFSVLL